MNRGGAETAWPPLPREVAPFVGFAQLLRAHGFSAASDQLVSFLEALALLGPRHMADIRAAAVATFAPPRERIAEFHALFDAHFLGRGAPPAPAATRAESEPLRVQEEAGGEGPELLEVEGRTRGRAASPAEAAASRRFGPRPEERALARFRREAPGRLPRRRTAWRVRAKRGRLLDLARTLRRALAREGEPVELFRRTRRTRQRRIVLLVDVSGSMKEHTETNLRFAHALARVAERIEVLTFGTRLTRITPAMRRPRLEQALDRAARTVRDWDGGTRIGEALSALLRVPRLAGFCRGALVLVISDGLERGDPDLLVAAVRRLARLSWKLVWLSPLAATPGYVPETAAMKAIRPALDALLPAGSLARLCREVLRSARELRA
ncbi:MAG: VWA domain-containing protein [Geminicoccaceae bacterium]|nr:VWA domain-containing protein [Geminicoccaceae bacterium]